MSYAANPRVTNPGETKVEKPGTVTSDSLAGESANSGGDFAANTNPSVLSQPSSSTTSNNTDISGATTLDAAPDAEARQASEEWSESSQLNAGIGLGKTAGRGPTWAPAGNAPSDGSYDTSGGNAGTAPSYVHSGNDGGLPAGKNITEGGFSTLGANASYNTNIGGKGDPGRLALNEFQRANAEPGDNIGRGKDGSNDNSFEALQSEEAS